MSEEEKKEMIELITPQKTDKDYEEEIERLNKKIEQYENPEDMTLMFMWCDEKAKDEIKRLNNIIKEANQLLEEYKYTNVEEYGKIIELYKKLKTILDKEKI